MCKSVFSPACFHLFACFVNTYAKEGGLIFLCLFVVVVVVVAQQQQQQTNKQKSTLLLLHKLLLLLSFFLSFFVFILQLSWCLTFTETKRRIRWLLLLCCFVCVCVFCCCFSVCCCCFLACLNTSGSSQIHSLISNEEPRNVGL